MSVMGRVVNIVLPDGSKKVFEAPTTGAEVALSIGPGLAKSAIAVIVNGVEWDLTRQIEQDSSVSIITRDSDEANSISYCLALSIFRGPSESFME